MKISLLRHHIALGVLMIACIQAKAGVSSKVTREVIEETVEMAARRSGREMGEQSARKAATETLERLTTTYGDQVLKVARDGGIELIESTSKYGDDVIEFALIASPSARRAFARDVPGLLPLTRRVGVDALELEARTPGLAAKVFTAFGDDGGKTLAKTVPTEDVPRLLSYAERADTPETRQLLLQAYKREKGSIFERIPAKLVIASGLTASMIHGTHRLTEPAVSVGDAIRENEDLAGKALWHFSAWGFIVMIGIAVLVLWRLRFMPWHWKQQSRNQEEPNDQEQTSDKALLSTSLTRRRRGLAFEMKKEKK